MSNVKERIVSAVSVMDEEDAEKIWGLILANFALSNVPEVQPDSDELAALDSFHSGSPEYEPSLSHEELVEELGL